MTLLQKLFDDTQDRQLIASRVLMVPRELVFKAWTHPQYLAQWWGPKGFTNTFERFEPVEGGEWKFVMHGPEGGQYRNQSRFIEVSPDRIIIQHLSPPPFHLVASFEELSAARTRIIFRQVFETVAERDRVKALAVEANEQNLDRLEEVVDSLMAGNKLFLIKTIKAMPDRVFDAWVNEELLKKWWGPHGFTNPVCKTDARKGGEFLIHMRSPDGMVFPTHGYYREVEKPRWLVFTSSAFQDENGIDQLENLNTVKFAEINGGTEVSLQVVVLRSNATADEALDGMEEGWRQSLDKLERIFHNI